MKNNHFRLDEKTVVLTGALTRHHVAITSALTELGANVGWIDRNSKDAARFAEQLNSQKEINPKCGMLKVFEGDLTKEHHVQDTLSQVAEAFGSIDVYIDGTMVFHSLELDEEWGSEELQRLIDINLKAPLLISAQVVKILRKRRRGRMIYLIGELQRMGGMREAINAATRNGLISFAKCLAKEADKEEMTVNCVSLGPTEEFLLQAFPDCKTVLAAEEKLRQELPSLKLCDHEGVAQVVLFLASAMSGAVNGQVISASRGLAMFG